MSHARSFAAVADKSATVLILGSMPGQASLLAQQYYAHPRNAFWRIQGDLIGARPELPYAERLRLLRANGIALWDVLESCIRVGSLDSDIEELSVVANDFAGFFKRHRNIRRVFFNGAKAEQSFQRHVHAGLASLALRYWRLPSTSPAHAGMPYAKKLEAWRAITAAELA
ncbi:MAG: DNA-deoxyinosine glycosylase [Nevskia sp.]|nr:DNA-deoxyinosine glycosylase [Nevskia sp.]